MDLKAGFDKPRGNFVMVPKAVLSSSSPLASRPSALLLWMLLLSVTPRKQILGREHLAKLVGQNLKTFERNLKILRSLGYVAGDRDTIVLTVGPEIVQTKEYDTIKPTEIFEKAIQSDCIETIESIPDTERWALIKEAWNKHKPKSYIGISGAIVQPLLVAIEAHIQKLNLEQGCYDHFLKTVLVGCSVHDWWKTKAMKASHVFGWGADLNSKKLENIALLYDLGITTIKDQEQQQQEKELQQLTAAKEEEEWNSDQSAQRDNARRATEKFLADKNQLIEAWNNSCPDGFPKATDTNIKITMGANQIRQKLDPEISIATFLERALASYLGPVQTLDQFIGSRSMIEWQHSTAFQAYERWQAMNNSQVH